MKKYNRKIVTGIMLLLALVLTSLFKNELEILEIESSGQKKAHKESMAISESAMTRSASESGFRIYQLKKPWTPVAKSPPKSVKKPENKAPLQPTFEQTQQLASDVLNGKVKLRFEKGYHRNELTSVIGGGFVRMEDAHSIAWHHLNRSKVRRYDVDYFVDHVGLEFYRFPVEDTDEFFVLEESLWRSLLRQALMKGKKPQEIIFKLSPDHFQFQTIIKNQTKKS